jgi:hypothetical protein
MSKIATLGGGRPSPTLQGMIDELLRAETEYYDALAEVGANPYGKVELRKVYELRGRANSQLFKIHRHLERKRQDKHRRRVLAASEAAA